MNKNIEESKADIIKALKSTRRKGISRLIKHVEEENCFDEPCSGGNHLCCYGGLAIHTANVIEAAEKIGKALLTAEEFAGKRASIRLVAALHDLGKAGSWDQLYYKENMIKDGRPTKANPEQKYKRSEAKPFECNASGLHHIDHPILSLREIEKYIELTPEEYHAILYHDGLYGTMAYQLKGHEEPLQTILHYADFWVSQFREPKSFSDIQGAEPDWKEASNEYLKR